MKGVDDMSTKDFTFSVGQMNQAALAFKEAGYTPGDVTRLRSNQKLLKDILQFLNGFAEISIVEHIIDCTVPPFTPEGWEIEKHIKGIIIQWNEYTGGKIIDHLEKIADHNIFIDPDELSGEMPLTAMPLTANILDYLVDHPRLVPREWRGKDVLFFGTLYRDRAGNLVVRYLNCRGSGNRWGYQAVNKQLFRHCNYVALWRSW